ncbi:hypothetical protein [Gemmatimonas sp.]|uniref:hypothetical protein n=1 Tax=Gemmatimonas sp. TaxID=1962908 RepID=UPI00286E1F68|nr:hypothetical protein [Gemmatimonas sp.]
MSRLIAVGSLVGALALGAWAWQFLNRAADSGLERLSRIDAMRALCTAERVKARTDVDSMRVDRLSLPDTVDQGSEQAIDRCGDLRGESVPNSLPNAREMSGDPMPRGLR